MKHISAERFDLSDMRRRFGENDTLIADLLRMFVDTHDTQLSAVKAAVEARQLDAVRRGAHTLKGMAGNLSFPRVMQASAQLEAAAERGDTAAIDRLFEILAREVAELVAQMDEQPLRSA